MPDRISSTNYCVVACIFSILMIIILTLFRCFEITNWLGFDENAGHAQKPLENWIVKFKHIELDHHGSIVQAWLRLYVLLESANWFSPKIYACVGISYMGHSRIDMWKTTDDFLHANLLIIWSSNLQHQVTSDIYVWYNWNQMIQRKLGMNIIMINQDVVEVINWRWSSIIGLPFNLSLHICVHLGEKYACLVTISL